MPQLDMQIVVNQDRSHDNHLITEIISFYAKYKNNIIK